MFSIELESYVHGNTNNPLLKIISKELDIPVSTLLFHVQDLSKHCFHNNITFDTLSLCEESLKILAELIDNVNFLSNQSNANVSESSWFLLKSNVNHVFQELKLKYPNVADIALKLSMTGSFIYMDENLLKRLLLNLLSNSLKFSWKSKIELYISKTKSGLEIIVRDSGIGIPEKEISLVFRPFIRGSNSGYKPGWGLGLPVVVKALTGLGGHIEVNSIPDKGSEFRVLIPCKISSEFKFDNIYS